MATFRKRGSSWQAQVRRKDHPPTTRTFARKADAQEWATKIEAQIAAGNFDNNPKLLEVTTLGQLIDRYIETVSVGKRSAINETIALRAFRRESICDKPVGRLSTADFAAYRDEQLQRNSAVSVQRNLSPVQNMFEIARVEWGFSRLSNPLRGLKFKLNCNRRERRLSASELQRLLANARTRRNPLIVPIIRFALETGMRRGEILRMAWTDIDFQNATLTIPPTKNGRRRTIPLTQEAIQVLGKVERRCAIVFPMSAVCLRQTWDRIIASAAINDLHFHDLRHEAISRFFEVGLSVPEVALISGHRDIRMLMRYAHGDIQAVRLKLASSHIRSSEPSNDKAI